MASVEHFRVHVPQDRLDQLAAKLAAADFPPHELDGAGWDYGVPLADIQRITTYWRDSFNWRQAEAELNEMPQFKTSIVLDGFDPIDLHFVHAKSRNPDAIPLLFCHGWPGSFDEVSKILPFSLMGAKTVLLSTSWLHQCLIMDSLPVSSSRVLGTDKLQRFSRS